MKLDDFHKLYPEIDQPQKSLFDLRAFSRYKRYPEDEFTTALIDFSIKRDKYEGYKEKPAAYLWSVITNKIVRWKIGQSNSKLMVTENLEGESYDDTPNFDFKSSIEKLNDFLKFIDNSNLRPGQKDLVRIMIEVCKYDHDSYRDFMKEVNEKAQKSGFSSDNIRKLLERIRLNMRGNDGAKGLLTFVRGADEAADEMLDFMMSMLPDYNPGFDAYRFSAQELGKMIWLKELFTRNGYKFMPDRFPKVYYTDFENYKKVYPVHEDANDNTPDYLGVYKYSYEIVSDDEKLLPCAESVEGFIVLFKDRIEKYSQRVSLDESDVRFVVLMHELGHWLTHWAFDENGKNWSVGYHLGNKYTKEALAQLIAYWATEDSSNFTNVLFALSPKDSSGEIDSEAVYGAYMKLVSQTKYSILYRLKNLRNYWILSDKSMYDYLISRQAEFEDWVKMKKESDSFKFIDDLMQNQIFEKPDCSFVFRKSLDLKNLFDLEILKLNDLIDLKSYLSGQKES